MSQKPAKFTFRKMPRETGLASVANPWPETEIKLRGKVVGRIAPPHWNSPDNLWRVRFMVKSAVERCGWKWITLKATFENEPAARVFIDANSEKLLALDLRWHED